MSDDGRRLRDLVRDGDSLFVSTGAGEPGALVAEVVQDVALVRRDLRFFQVMTGSSGRLVAVTALGHALYTPVPHGVRMSPERPRLRLADLSMGQYARAFETGEIRVDGALLSAVRSGDRLWPVPSTDLAVVAFERARFRAVEVLGGAPRVLAGPSFGVAEADYVVATEAGPRAVDAAAPTEVSRRIGAAVAELVPARATIELGIGQALASVADDLVAAGRSLAVHTGLISDWTRTLVETGVADRPLACAGGKPVLGTVAMGSQAFYDWLDQTEAVAFADSRHAQDPLHLGRLTPFVAINSAMAVGLNGDVGLPPTAPGAHGPGGLLDFAIAGAYGGLSVVAVTSRSRSGGSRIVPDIATVHLPSTLVTHVVTEHGVADLRGRTPGERRRLLVDLADPEHRPALRHHA